MKLPRKIYAIQHNVTKKIYIGSSANVRTRYLSHLQNLRAGKHIVEDMQADFDRYGENYSFYILDEITSFADRSKEYEWMLKYSTCIRGVGYNYNDHAKCQLHLKNTPYKSGLPEMFSEMPTSVKYRVEIVDYLNRCEDLSLMDLIYQLLKKRESMP